VIEDERIVGGEEWQEKVHNKEEWKKLLRTTWELSHSAHANGMNEWMHANKILWTGRETFNNYMWNFYYYVNVHVLKVTGINILPISNV